MNRFGDFSNVWLRSQADQYISKCFDKHRKISKQTNFGHSVKQMGLENSHNLTHGENLLK